MELEPNDIMILGAVSQGAKEFAEISNRTNIELQKVLDVLERLVNKGFIAFSFEKKGLRGIKKETVLTDKGSNELKKREFELKQNWNQTLSAWKTGDKQKIQQHMDENRLIFPSMMFLGIMDMAVFSKIMDFLGLATTSFIPDQYTSKSHDTSSNTREVFGEIFKSVIKHGFRNDGGGGPE